MKDLRKRTLILTLASVIAVTGSFAAENYKNCLMSIGLTPGAQNEVSVTLNTKKLYSGNFALNKKDARTYLIMLPEVDNAAPTPNLSSAGGGIESIEIRKMPYSNGNKGYTRVTIRTDGTTNIKAQTAIFVAAPEESKLLPQQNSSYEDVQRERQENITNNFSQTYNPTPPVTPQRQKKSVEQKYEQTYNSNPMTSVSPSQSQPQPQPSIPVPESSINTTIEDVQSQFTPDYSNNDDTSFQKYLLGLMVIGVIFGCGIFIIKGQEKMTNMNLEIDLDDEKKDKATNNKKSKKISTTINKLDAAFPKTSGKLYKPSTPQMQIKKTEEDNSNVVDLDVLFKEHKKSSNVAEDTGKQQANDALDDFLSDYTFLDEEISEIEESSESDMLTYDEEEYEKVLSNDDIKFTKDDILCLNELLQSEITNDTMKNINMYVVSNPIVPQKPSKDKILENLVTEYTISQDIKFTSEDVNILRKLISVELDEDFVKDLRTNAYRVKEVDAEIRSEKHHRTKPSEILTLNVHDMLPNLSEELRLQGDKPIMSERKAETVYFSDGYDVQVLSSDIELPDLSKEINNKASYSSKPSVIIPTVDNSFLDTVKKLKTTGLPDLEDVLANPEKYQEPEPESFIADEQSLMNSIIDVKLKPFDDRAQGFEIINEIEEEDSVDAPTVFDIQKEFSQFENFEFADEAEEENINTSKNYDVFSTLGENSFVDLDSELDSDLISDLDSIVNKESVQIDKNSDKSELFHENDNEILKELESEEDTEGTKNINNVNSTAEIAENEQFADIVPELEDLEDNYEITNDDVIVESDISEIDLANNNESAESNSKNVEDQQRTEDIDVVFERKISPHKDRRNSKLSEDLINKINNAREERRLKNVLQNSENVKTRCNKNMSEVKSVTTVFKCLLDGKNYDVVGSVSLGSNIGCYLAKSNTGYVVLAYKESNLKVIKEYDSLKSSKIQARLSETLDDGTPRYLIRIGLTKFIVDVKNNDIEYVMDLC